MHIVVLPGEEESPNLSVPRFAMTVMTVYRLIESDTSFVDLGFTSGFGSLVMGVRGTVWYVT